MYSGTDECLLLRLVSEAARSVRNVLAGTKSTMNNPVIFRLLRNALSEKSIL